MLPDTVRARLDKATAEQLESWALKVLNARSLDEAFDQRRKHESGSMRLEARQIQAIERLVVQVAGEDVHVRVVASISRTPKGRKVHVLISTPKLPRLPIHEVAYQEGVLL